MSRGIYQPHGPLRRITPNAGNRRVLAGGLRGGAPPVPATPPVFSGPNLANITMASGSPMTPVDVRGSFTNITNFTKWYLRGPWPVGVTIINGVIQGTTSAGAQVLSGSYVLAKNVPAPQVASNTFTVTIT